MVLHGEKETKESFVKYIKKVAALLWFMPLIILSSMEGI